jgi:hypothetical protein
VLYHPLKVDTPVTFIVAEVVNPSILTPPSNLASVVVMILSVDATPVSPEPSPVITPTTDIPEGLTSNDLVPPATMFT